MSYYYLSELEKPLTAQKMKFSIKDFFSKCDQIRRFPRIWSHLLQKSLTENLIFCAVTHITFQIWKNHTGFLKTFLILHSQPM